LGSLACMKTLLPLAFMVALAATPAAATARTLVSFEQSGGIAGVSVSVAVSTTGHVTGDVSGGQSRQVAGSVRAVVDELVRISRGGR
jgi:outer membrane receptor protein involved in Fe transport